MNIENFSFWLNESNSGLHKLYYNNCFFTFLKSHSEYSKLIKKLTGFEEDSWNDYHTHDIKSYYVYRLFLR